MTHYEAALVAVITASDEKDDTVVCNEHWYKDKIASQMKELDPILNKLFEVVNAFKPPESLPAQANKGNRLLSCIKRYHYSVYIRVYLGM